MTLLRELIRLAVTLFINGGLVLIIVKLVTLLFGLTFTWQLGIGIYLIMMVCNAFFLTEK